MLGLSVTFFPKHKFTNCSKTTYINKSNNKAKKRKLSYIIKVPDRQDIDIKNIQKENDTLQKENDTLQIKNIQKENDTLQKENDTLQKENDTFQKENDTLQKENDTLQKENDTLRDMINIYQTNYIHQ
jgi:hypothetical protein